MTRTRTADSRPDHEVLIIGTGFAGLGMAIQLKKAGFTDFLIVEREAEVGGTWYVNTYPGCACDVQSHMYSFSFEPNPDWSREFSPQPEILAYLKRCADKYELRPQIRFGTQAIGAAYDEAACLWRVKLARASDVERFMKAHDLKPGDPIPEGARDAPAFRVVSARAVVSGMGGLSTPAYPSLKGIETFQGKTFHSQRWDHGYDLTGKRVAVLGTGASSIQFVPQIQPQVKKLDLYQRTPPWIMPKPDRKISAPERWAFAKLPGVRHALRATLYARLESRAIAFVVNPKLLHAAEPVARLFMRMQVRDPALRKKLTPHYAMGCKRVLMSNDWYPALTQPNVDVVSDGIGEVRAHSIVDTLGVERPVDAIIYGTGFRVSDLVAPGMIFGRGGRDIVEGFRQGPEAYKGTTIAGFPNLFLLMGPNTGLGHNSVVFMIEAQIAYVLSALKLMREQSIVEIDVKQAVMDEFNVELQARSQHTVWKSGGCNSYYLDPVTGRNIAAWPDFTFKFRWQTRSFDVDNYVLKPAVGA